MLLRRVTHQSDSTETIMRSLQIFLTLSALFAVIYCTETEQTDFVVVVKDNTEQNITTPTTTTEKYIKPNIKNLVITRLKNKKYDVNNNSIENKKNETAPKIMYKFEAKDGRMKFQRDVENYKSTETQTESYEPIDYEPVQEKSPEVPNYSYYQQPVMFYTLCPVYPDQLSNYQIQNAVNLHRRPKQLLQYVPVSNSYTNYVPSNYGPVIGHQYENQEQYYGNGVRFKTQNNNNGYEYNNYNTKYQNNGGNEQKLMYIINTLNRNPKYNTAYYEDYKNGIDNQANYYQANQNYVYVPVYERPSKQYSQYYNTNNGGVSQQSSINNVGTYQHQNTYYNPHVVHNKQIIRGSYIDPTTGSYQIEVGNAFTDITSSNVQVLNTKYENKPKLYEQVTVVSPSSDTPVKKINHSQLNSQLKPENQYGQTYFHNKGNGQVAYYYYDNTINDINPMFESLKIKAAQR